MAGMAFTRLVRRPPWRAGRRKRLSLAVIGASLLAASVGGYGWAQVQVQTLPAPDLFSAGAGADELPDSLWTGSSAALARAVIPTLGQAPLSPAAAALARRVLSTGAIGPEGAGQDPDLAGARALALLGLGDAAAVQAIVSRTPNLGQKPALSQAGAEAALDLGQDDQACAIEEALAVGRDQPYWLRLRAYCQVLGGLQPAAQLTLQLAGTQGAKPDFERLMAALLAKTTGQTPALDDGLDYALSRRVAADWTQGVAAAPAAIAVALARDPATPPAARVQAAARAARLGLPQPAAYAGLAPPPVATPAAAQPPAPADGSAPPPTASAPPSAAEVAASADQPGPAGEAALVALAAGTSDLTLKEAATLALLKRAQTPAEFQALAGLARPQIAQFVAAQAVFRQPVSIAMAAASAGDAASARVARAQAGQAGAPPSPLDLALLDALIDAAAGQPTDAVGGLAGALAGADAAGGVRVGAAMAELAAQGAVLGPDHRYALSLAPLAPGRASPARLMALQLSADQGRAGDTALYALAVAAQSGAQGLAPADRAALIGALSKAGMKADARALAVEGLVQLQGPR